MTEPKKDDTVENLQKALVDVLTKPLLDFGQLVDISTRLSRLDPDYVRFASDSGLIDRLGQELVARQETAVSELVKNAYDADARELKVTFVNAEAPGGSLLMIDDGHGMDRDQLINGFMRLASNEKQTFPISPLYRRGRAGRKGLGRFSAQRLGAHLEVVTQTANAAHAWKLSIDWTKFTSGTDLHQIATRVEVVPKERQQGTTLNILGLRERWSDAQISRVFRYVEELLDPFPSPGATLGSAPSKADIDPGFKAVFLRRTAAGLERLIASEDRMVLDQAIAKIHAEVDEDGKAWTTLVSARLGLNEKEPLRIKETESQTTFAHLRNVKLEAHYFIYDSDLMPSQVRGRLQRLANEQGGFRLYRNGFRVLPYGERRNDWLGLDEESRRRVILPAIANVNWLGAISIVDPEHSVFFEVSSREGLAMNEAMSELITFGHAVAVKCATRVASSRGRKTKAGPPQKASRPLPSTTPDALREAAADLKRSPDAAKVRAGDAPAADGPVQQPSSMTAAELAKRDLASQLLVVAADQIEEQSKEIEMLRVLASLGLVVATFTHEARNRVMSMRDQLAVLLSDESLPEGSLRRIADLRTATQDLKSYLGYFEGSLAEVQKRELEQQDVSALLYDFVRAFKPISDRWNIAIDTYIDEGLISKPMLGSEWSSILTNLFTNSVKAIKRAEQDRGQILIRAVCDQKWIQVDFMDNGDGIAPEHWESIFDPFFTLSAASHDEDLTGMGLGLKIVRDTVASRNGLVLVIEPPQDFRACIRVKIPADQTLTT